jgi:signal peptidase I
MSEKNENQPPQNSEAPKKKSSLEEFFAPKNLLSLAAIIVGVLAFRWSVGAPYEVPTSSMAPTITAGDRLVGNHLAYHLRLPFLRSPVIEWSSPERGDIVVFQGIENPDIDMVKRVVALAGERIRIENGLVYINGEPLKQELKSEDFERVTSEVIDDITGRKLYREKFPDNYEHWMLQDSSGFSPLHNWPGDGRDYIVPEDSVLVLGDNRDNSKDSRFWGPVPIDRIYGRAEFVLWSMRPLLQETGVEFKVRWSRFGTLLHRM